MISLFRRFLNTWLARAFFVLLVGSFALWGVADVARNLGGGSALATVGSTVVEVPEFQEMFRRQLAQVSRMLGGRTEPTPAIRQAVAGQVLDRMVVQAAIGDEVRRLGLAVPDEALRQAVFEMPAFRDPAGRFSRIAFESVLRNNGLTEPRFLALMRSDLGQRQLMEAVQVGVTPPEVLLDQVFAFQREARVADLVELPFSAAPDPGAPTPADLKKAYEDNPPAYSAPAFRRIKAVILSADTVARGIEVPEADVASFYDSHKSEFTTPEKRSVEVIVAADEAVAAKLATAWIAGADWTEMQAQAQAAGASSVVLDDSARPEFPSPELADAVFGAASDTVVGPVKSAFGFQVMRVTKVTPGTEQPLAEVHDAIRTRIARERAVDQVYARANKLEDALSAGTTLDDLPGDLGVAAIAGTLDASGNTPSGEAAPIPGSPALRQAIITAAFALAKNEPARMTEGPDQSYFTVVVEDTTEPMLKPFDQVEGRVREDWEHQQRRRAQEQVAAKLLIAAKAGGSLDDAAVVAGLRTQRTPPMLRSAPTEGVPRELTEPVFALKKGEATMVETPQGFLVASLVDVTAPASAADPAAAGQMRTALTQALSQDFEVTYAGALRDRLKPRVNRTLLDSLAQ